MNSLIFRHSISIPYFQRKFRTQNEELKTLAAVVDYIAAEEASSAYFSGMSATNTIAGSKSTYKQLHTYKSEKVEPVKCRFCGGKHPGDMTPGSRQQHCKAYDKKWSKCQKPHHFAAVCQSTPKTVAAVVDNPPDPVHGALTCGTSRLSWFLCNADCSPTRSDHLRPFVAALSAEGPVTSVPLPHVVHTVHAGWLVRAAQPSPNLLLSIQVERSAYSSLCLPVPRTSLKATRSKQQQCCADTGAQLTTVPLSLLSYLGVQSSSLLPIATNLNTVTGAPVDLVGGIFLEFSETNLTTGVTCRSKQLAYVSSTIPYTFLSREACADMGLIPTSFPSIGSCSNAATIAGVTCSNDEVSDPAEPHCSCPVRQLPPSLPPVLPCAPTEENLLNKM